LVAFVNAFNIKNRFDIMKNLFLILFLFTCHLTFAQEGPNTLTIIVNNLDNSDGNLLVSMFTPEDDWLKESDYAKKIELEGENESLEVTFEGIEPGTYAVSIIHDEDGNGKLNMGAFGPSEAYGFSNNAKGSFGPPDFEKCTFEYKGGKQMIEIDL